MGRDKVIFFKSICSYMGY